MRSLTYSYKHLFRNTALAALVLGVLPAYAQVGTPAPTYSLGLPAKRVTKPAAQNGGNAAPALGNSPLRRKRKDLVKQIQQRTHMRAGSNGKVDWSAYQRAMLHRARMPNAPLSLSPVPRQSSNSFLAELLAAPSAVVSPGSGSIPTGAVTTWTSLGPYNMTAPYLQGNIFVGPGANTGRINSIARDPGNVNVIYIAAPTGGIWKTIDGGVNWTPLTDSVLAGDIPIGLAFSSIAIDPSNSQVLYAGSGDYDGGEIAGSGLYKSIDGGIVWTNLSQKDPLNPSDHGLPSGSNTIRALVVDPNNSAHITVGLGRDVGGGGVDGAIYSSTDGGVTWASLPELVAQSNGFVNRLVYNRDGTALYAAIDGDGVYVKDSTKTNTWQPVYTLDPNDPATNAFFSRLDVAVSPTDPNKAYILSAQDTAIFKTTDRGVTVLDITNGFPNDYSLGDGGVWGQAFYDFNLAVGSQAIANTPGVPSPLAVTPGGTTTSDVIYVGLFSVIAGDENGVIWNDIAYSYTPNALTHTDQHAMLIDPTVPNTFFVGNDGGISKGVYNPDGRSAKFTNLNATLCITQFYDMVSHPTNPGVLLGGTQDNAQPYVNGNFKRWATIVGGDGGYAAIDPNYPATMYVSYTSGDTYINADDSWTNLINGGPQDPSYAEIPMPTVGLAFIVPMDMDWVNTEFVYGAEQNFFIYDHGPFVSPIKPGKWTKGGSLLVTTDPIAKDHFQFDFATALTSARTIGPTGEEILYAGTSLGTVWYSGGRGGDATECWFQGSGDGNGSSGNPQWVPDVQVTALKPDPLNPKRLFLGIGGTGLGKPHLYRCDNITKAAPVWIPIDGGGAGVATGLPDIPVTAFELMPQDDGMAMYAGTDIGLFYSSDGGAHWSKVDTITNGDVLPSTEISKIVFNPSTGNLDIATYGRGIWRKTVGSTVPFQMQLGLARARGSRTKLTAKVDFFHTNVSVNDYPSNPGAAVITKNVPGGPVTDYFHYYSAPSETRTVSLSAAGYFLTNISSKGVYDVYVTVPGYLRKKIPVVQTTRGLLLTPLMTAGDVTGDNIIDGRDVQAVARAIGSYTNGPLDVDGDGVVTGRDLAIVIANAGLRGD